MGQALALSAYQPFGYRPMRTSVVESFVARKCKKYTQDYQRSHLAVQRDVKVLAPATLVGGLGL
ncbi:hypothetical protein AUEXF2481DRAFT_40636 [Aureobasidium subglaciale EXF-2481]|uniref:Uncharacterized protein n=1 Tax=Aureobasidium subglaciale (strain EXF-2481) TaxID=1043005 RepID=A0A074YF90_AURSE|nr:uncharacterized protein AUEXF2481DRAFT_40636 [Aureobasidium subglaciale EXF-2481]KEQ94704.1 hypothetical protein AUEXF2481DRAFT_40636 [Aureobasidium subglaciale EXF-2481]